MNDQDYGTGAEELGATVQPPSHYVYQFRCNDCSAVGTEWPTENEAQNEGRNHQVSDHWPAPNWSVQSIGKP